MTFLIVAFFGIVLSSFYFNNIECELENDTLYIELKNNSVACIEGEGKLSRNDIEQLLSSVNLSSITVENIVIGDNIAELGFNCLGGFSALKTLKIGMGIKEIKNYAVTSCTSLKYLFFPDSVEVVGKGFLDNCFEVCVYSNGKYQEIMNQLQQTNLFAHVIDSKEFFFIAENITSYEQLITSSPYALFEGNCLAVTDPASGNNPITIRSGYVQYGPYMNIREGRYLVNVNGDGFDFLNDANIYLNLSKYPELKIQKENTIIEKNKISYYINIPQDLSMVEFCVSNSSNSNNVIEVHSLEIHKIVQGVEAFQYWFD